MAAALLIAIGGPAEPQTRPKEGVSRVTVTGQVTVRVRGGAAAPQPQQPVEWREDRGPRCIRAATIAGAALIGRDRVDIILRDNRRLRVRLERSCPAIDFYRGFYLKPNPDGRICADRDVIRSRMGGECGIDVFRSLKPAKRD